MKIADTLVVIEHGRLQPFAFDPFKTCHELGLRPLFVTNDLAEYFASAVSAESVDKYVDEVIETDISDPARVVAALAEAQASGRLLGVFSITEYGVVTVADVASALGLPGLSPAAARNARHKHRTRRLCAAAGVPVPEHAWVRSAAEARSAAARLGGACVVKPLSEAGGIGVRLCAGPEEAAEHYAAIAAAGTDRRGNPRPPGALVEKYAPGYQVSVEVVHTGRGHHVVGVTDGLFGGRPHFVELGETYPSLLPEHVRRDCADVAVRALGAIGHDFGAAHVEVRVTADGPVLIEVNARLAGAQITRLIHEAQGVNLLREAIRLHAGRSADLTVRRDGAAAVRYLTSPVGGVLSAVRGHAEAEAMPGVIDVDFYVAPGARVRPPENIADVTGYVTATGRTPGEAARRADAAALEIGFVVDPPGTAGASASGPESVLLL
ncbi:ATP-grasp domain-containing protein [Actinomadura sp. KC216]|uniref:ATP-grasp domain-containing protein n=1 Tax=Actinomadura sp. KC216 TaxID=2530370 RepID=UPI00104E900C|nr:ATP-grasp domain-containing protein [Actinomadura sp. KC216]TDB90692.1 ATP-grasp domain-containing protein [Actinomadura sp. KC216]